MSKPEHPHEATAIAWLARKVADEGYITIPQVGNATGFGKRRTADAIMVQTWPSRGLAFTGIEYKRTRADWRRELRHGQKAEAVAAFCKYWIVFAPQGIVPVVEVPPGWGLWEMGPNNRLLRTKPPPVQDEVKPPDISFLVAVLRASEKVDRNAGTLEADRLKLEAEYEDRVEKRARHLSFECENLKKKVAEFEEASGISITKEWAVGRIGEGLKDYLKHPGMFLREARSNRNSLRHLLDEYEKIEGIDS